MSSYHVNFQHGPSETLPRPDAGFDPHGTKLVDLENVRNILPLWQHGGVPLVDVDAEA